MTELESWMNSTPGRVWVNKFDARGNLAAEIIASGRTFHLSPQERRVNQEMAASEELDVFSNGTLQPVRLLEGDESDVEIASKPNHLSDSDIKDLVKAHHKTLEKRLEQISNPSALERVLEAALEVDASVSTVERIKSRMREVAPSLYTEVATVSGPAVGREKLKAVTPK